MKVKICGITRMQDALLAIDAGADLLGFNFYPRSPRYLSPEACTALTSQLRRRGCTATLVGVFVNPALEDVLSILKKCDLDLAQLSGDEDPVLLEQLDQRAFKALRPADETTLTANLARYPLRATAPALLIDAYRPGAFGGTGQTADWGLAALMAAKRPLLLAGGLTPDNVSAAIRQVRPWGVDVASGVENEPGCKDAEKMRAFINAAKNF
ncbi:MAG: phosphoribosylanthranilate isomerase [Anaerolineae bacterium]|nr:phosphoribosylanthranilate isomerase [Anaerolineae bacterium]